MAFLFLFDIVHDPFNGIISNISSGIPSTRIHNIFPDINPNITIGGIISGIISGSISGIPNGNLNFI